MPDLSIEYRFWCASNEYWEKEITGKHGTYTVTWHKNHYECTCQGFKFRKSCLHIKEAEGKRCAWNWEACMGSGETERPKDGRCPKCGTELSSIAIGV